MENEVSTTPCLKCGGCGQVADTDEQEPWTAWEALRPGEDTAVRLGFVVPITCPNCNGLGVMAINNEDRSTVGKSATPASFHTPNSSLPPLVSDGPRRMMLIEIEVSADFEQRLDNQWEVEREINADRWFWRWGSFSEFDRQKKREKLLNGVIEAANEVSKTMGRQGAYLLRAALFDLHRFDKTEGTTPTPLSFALLQEMNERRCEEVFHAIEKWSETDWMCAVAGEVGEAANKIKKRRRGENIPVDDVIDEMADAVIYLDLLATRLGAKLEDGIRRKFDEVSVRRGSSLRLGISDG